MREGSMLGMYRSGLLAGAALVVSAGPAMAQTGAATSTEVTMVADRFSENRTDNTLIAEGNVEASYEGRVLRADRVVYNRTTETVRATGNVVIIEPDGTQRFADEIEVDSTLSDGYAVGFSLRLPNGATAVASSAVRDESGVNTFEQVVYTACEICEGETPTWSLRARKATLNEQTDMFSYRDAVLEVGGVPVVYLPYFAHPDPSAERRSGLLVPDAGLSSKLGAFYAQPYLWAISESQDITISPLISEKVNPLLELDYRKRFYSGQLRIKTSFTKERLFDSDGERDPESDESWRSHVFADGLFSLSNNWRWGFGIERTSDDLYIRRYDIDGENDLRGLYANQPNRLLSQLFLVGQGESFYAEASILSFQGLRENDDDEAFPLAAPLLTAERTFDLGGWGHAGVTASAAALTRENGFDSERVSLGADWSGERVLPGGLVFDPFLDGRIDYYGLDEALSGEDSVTRAVGSVGARLSYPMIRTGESVDLLVEPIAMGAWGVSNANDPAIPNEDSILYEFDDSRLFASNGFANYDLYEGDGRAAFGVEATALWKNGVEISTIAGRRWRSRSDPAFDEFSNLDGTVSDWIAGAAFDFGKPLRLETHLRLDDDGLELNRVDARLDTAVWRLRGSVQYFRTRDEVTVFGQPEEGIAINSRLQMSERLSLLYGRVRDIEDGRDTLHAVGLSYQDGCSLFEISYRQKDSRDRELGPSEAVQFRFRLLSLGQLGSRDFD